MVVSSDRLPLGGARARCPFVPVIDEQTEFADSSYKTISADAVSACQQGGLPTEALAAAEEKMEEFLKSGDKKKEACMKLAAAELRCFLNNGNTDFEEALERAGEAMSTFQDLKDKAMEATAQLVLSSLSYKRQRTKECYEAASAAFLLFEELKNKGGQAKAYHAIALSYMLPDDYDNAMKSFKKELAICKDLGLQQQQSRALQCIADSYMVQDRPQKAMKAAKAALALELKGSKKGQALALLQLAEAMVADGHGKRAAKVVQDGLAKLREGGDAEAILGGLQALFHTHLMLGSLGEAVQVMNDFDGALNEIKEDRTKQYANLDVLHSRSRLSIAFGDVDSAVGTLKEASEIAAGLDDAEEQSEALKAIAVAYTSKDDTKPMADEFIEEARGVCQEAGDTIGEAAVVMLSARLLVQNNKPAEVILGEITEARALYQEAEDIVGEAAALNLMVDCNIAKEDYAQAMETASDSLELYKQLGKKKGQAAALGAVANIHVIIGDTDDASGIIEEGLALAQEVGAKAAEARLQLLLTQVCIASMQKEELPTEKKTALPVAYVEARTKALRATRIALDLASKAGDKNVQASAYFWRAEALVWDARGTEAFESAKQAEKQYEKCKDGIGQAHSKVLQSDIKIMMGDKEGAKGLAEHGLWLCEGKPNMDACRATAHRVIEKATRVEVPVMDYSQMQYMPQPGQDMGGAPPPPPMAESVELAAPGLTKEYVLGKVLDLAQNVVADGEPVEQDVPFMEAGIDSLGSVQFVTDVSKEFMLQLSPAVIFDYPTARALIDHIIEESAG